MDAANAILYAANKAKAARLIEYLSEGRSGMECAAVVLEKWQALIASLRRFGNALASQRGMVHFRLGVPALGPEIMRGQHVVKSDLVIRETGLPPACPLNAREDSEAILAYAWEALRGHEGTEHCLPTVDGRLTRAGASRLLRAAELMPHGPIPEEWAAWGEYLITDYVSAEEPPQLLVNAMFRYASMWASSNILAGTAPFQPLTPEDGTAHRVEEVGKWLITRDIISGNLSAAESPISPVLYGTHHAESPDYRGAWEAWRTIANGFVLERLAEATRDTNDNHLSGVATRYARIRCHNMSREE